MTNGSRGRVSNRRWRVARFDAIRERDQLGCVDKHGMMMNDTNYFGEFIVVVCVGVCVVDNLVVVV